MKQQFSIIISLLFLVLPGSIANAASGASNIRVDYSCPGKVTVTYDLTTSQPTDITLKYSPNKSKWFDADAVTGDIEAQTTGTGKTIVWDCFADNVRIGGFYFKIELSQPELDCVWINGVCWATRNVDMPGTFVANPEDAGMFYQWNRNIGWSASDPMINSNGNVTWDSSMPTGTTWEKVNDPSPEGYRIPTREEQQKLLDISKVNSAWTFQNGRPGRKFTDIDTGNFIFLPAAGIRHGYAGALESAGLDGGYWGSSVQEFDGASAYGLRFSDSVAHWGYLWTRLFGLSVRSVAED